MNFKNLRHLLKIPHSFVYQTKNKIKKLSTGDRQCYEIYLAKIFTEKY